MKDLLDYTDKELDAEWAAKMKEKNVMRLLALQREVRRRNPGDARVSIDLVTHFGEPA